MTRLLLSGTNFFPASVFEIDRPGRKFRFGSLLESSVGHGRNNETATERVRNTLMKIIVVSESTDHGCKVISGLPLHDIDGTPITQLSDQLDCPRLYPGGNPHGVNKIVTAHSSLSAGGIAVAVEGCVTECGCKLTGSHRASVG